PDLSTAYVEPRDAVERELASIWQAMLGVEPVGVHDAFLELGGDSLLAARMAARVREVFDIDLTPGAFFEAGTIEGLAEIVHEARTATDDEPTDDDVAELMAMIDAMDEDELAAELAKRE
ncbi:MAG: phosphopantetheine-binding protein, partial [Acidobacteriota bacterium]